MSLSTQLQQPQIRSALTNSLPFLCSRGLHKQARLHKLCNFVGPVERSDDTWIKLIGYYGREVTPHVGSVVKVTYKGEMFKAVITGLVRDREDCPRFDTNNCVFVNDQLEPLGTRITGPVSVKLRAFGKYNKIVSLCTEFH